jgi:hypothetical protein
LIAIEDFEALGKTDDRFKTLSRLVKENGGLWCREAEEYLLKSF